MTGSLIRREETQTQREGHVTTQAEIGVTLPRAKECQGVPATPEDKEARKDAPLEGHRGTQRLGVRPC